MKAVILAGGLARGSPRRPRAAEADGRDRRQADPLAHHEDLLAPTASTTSCLPRLQGLRDQGILRELLPAHVGRHLRPRATIAMDVHQRQGRAVAGDAGRHRRGHEDRRPPQARRCPIVDGRADFCSPTATASPTSTSRALIAFHRGAWQAGDRHRRPAARPLRRARARRRRASTASRRSRAATAAGSTAASSCCRPSVLDYIDGDDDGLGARAAGAAGARRPADGVHAHAASGSRWTRCATRSCSRSCGRPGTRALEGLG